MSSSSTAAAVASKICFNTQCKESIPEQPRRRGWRLRCGNHADLCDRCFSAYEQGTFCEAFHSEADGWRKCPSCGKRVHCGCIVSFGTFVLLDVGGIECIICARKNSMSTNQTWPSPTLSSLPSERLKDLSVKSWSQLTATSPVPGQWRQSPSTWSASIAQSELQQRLAYEFDRPNGHEKLASGLRPSVSAQERRKLDLPERLTSSSINHAAMDKLVNGSTGLEAVPPFNAHHREKKIVDGLQNSELVGEIVRMTKKGGNPDSALNSSAGSKFGSSPNSFVHMQLPSSILKDGSSRPLIGTTSPFFCANETNDPSRASTTQRHRQTPPSSLAKQYRGGNHLLPRYWPRITDQELQQISGGSNSVITPLFEKMLSASDAGRIGRLVLPKKCAEAYFPAISQPEGLPLKVQDARGKEWIFQFRFWPNNNSRMYVLEGVTPCIQSMQLQAGDTVTFSRIDPEGKLVMGFRKASSITSEQEIQMLKGGNDYSTTTGVHNRNSKPLENKFITSLHPSKDGGESRNLTEPVDQAPFSKFAKSGFTHKEGPAAKTSAVPTKRKNITLGSKRKRLRIENEESIELTLTWEEAQELLRPPPNHVPSVVVIEGHEIEEYEVAPILGKPTIFLAAQDGKNQWAQCEDCYKWRKLPVDALLPPRWTCSDNSWDPEKSSCSSAQEISNDYLLDMISSSTAASKKRKAKVENDDVEVSDGLDTLANLAILGEGEILSPFSQPTTKHPRHRPGCLCIVCIQPPSGKGPKHKQTCTCNVCLTVRRRFRTLMLRKEKRQSEKEAEAVRKKQQPFQPPEILSPGESDQLVTNQTISRRSQKQLITDNETAVGDPNRKKALPSPIMTQIDLNIQPEKEEEPSPVSDSCSMMRSLQDAVTW